MFFGSRSCWHPLWRARGIAARSLWRGGMSGHDDDDATIDVFDATVAAAWERWRADHPVRACAPAPGGITDAKQPKPSGTGGRPWTTYRTLQSNSTRRVERVQQEWLYVPYASLVGGTGHPPKTQPLAGFTSRSHADGFLHTYKPLGGGDPAALYEVYTNVFRIMQLASSHPAIEDCDSVQINKATETRVLCSRTMRALKGHQAPFNLKLTLAASGATFYMGLSAQGVAPNMLKLWYGTGRRCDADRRQLIRAVFSTFAKRNTSHLERCPA